MEAATRRSPRMDVASIQPSWLNSSRWEQHRQCSRSQSSKVNSTGCMAGSISQPQRRLCPKCPEDSREKSNQVRTERKQFGTRSPAPGSRRKGSRLLLFFYPALLLKNGAGEGDGGEFGSPSGGEERQSTVRRLSSSVACRWSTKSSTAGTDSRAHAQWMPRDRGELVPFIVWLGGGGGLVVKTKANVEESIGTDESGLVDRSCFQVVCWRGSTAESMILEEIVEVVQVLKGIVEVESWVLHEHISESCAQIAAVQVPQVAEQVIACSVAVPVPLSSNESFEEVSLAPHVHIFCIDLCTEWRSRPFRKLQSSLSHVVLRCQGL